jgi:uncharacterized OB-fold protein
MTSTSLGPARDLLAEYREGLLKKRLLLPKCGNCGQLQFPPKTVCQYCHAVGAWEMTEVSGRARVWSYVVFHKRYLAEGPETPYDVTVVELDEGPRVFGKILGGGEIVIGAVVEAVFEGSVLAFRPASRADATA